MPKLYWRYGTIASRKSMELLAVRDTYQRQGKKVLVIKPRIDVRDGEATVSSRTGLSCCVDAIIDGPEDIVKLNVEGVSAILSDESQFHSASTIEALRKLTTKLPVIAYGLRTDFQSFLFEGSKRLMELADSIEEIKTTCLKCNSKANFNLRHKNGIPVRTGKQIELGKEDMYAGVCYIHFVNFLA